MKTVNSHKVKRDLVLIGLSILAAVVLFRLDVFGILLASIKDYRWIVSLVAGFFSTSTFAAAPATVLFIEIMQKESIILTAFLGALGSSFSEFIIFHIIKGELADDFEFLIKRERKFKRLLHIFHRKSLFGWIMPLLGALIVASPLPDEIALAMMGLSRTKTSIFVAIVFALRFFGLLVLGLAVQAV